MSLHTGTVNANDLSKVNFMYLLADSAGVARSVPITYVGVKNIGSSGCAGFTHLVVLKIIAKVDAFSVHSIVIFLRKHASQRRLRGKTMDRIGIAFN